MVQRYWLRLATHSSNGGKYYLLWQRCRFGLKETEGSFEGSKHVLFLCDRIINDARLYLKYTKAYECGSGG
jgi:hypothetical protein